jgi:hypothetical protein
MSTRRRAETRHIGAKPGLSPEDRRNGRRFPLPFGWGAILETGVSSHVVAVVDVSLSGCYLATRLAAEPGTNLLLKLVFVNGGTLALPCEVVRNCTSPSTEEDAPPRGLAVRFCELQPSVYQRLALFVEGRKRAAG